ncbi:MAG TPA: multiheme c-type cytochrome [Enhygromyxa sp.]|nr:multiheme c-type cytochrome [Enhygromyxa sp.]
MKHARFGLGFIAGVGAPLLGLSAALILSCGQAERAEPLGLVEPDPSVRTPNDREPGPLADPHFLAAPTRFAPALTDIAPGDHAPTGAQTADLDTCATCHEEISIQWRTSAHAFASFNNPIYRASIERFRAEQGGADRSRFCAGCHDPALLIDGVMTGTIEAADPRAHIGVGCRSCHGVAESTDDGNGSYTLAAAELPIPEMDDPASIEVHRQAMGPARTQCNSCHRAFLGLDTGHPHHINGTDEPGPWHDSSYAGNKLRLDTPVKERDCADCHMPVEVVDARATDPAIDPSDRTLRSHRFIGGHSWMAAMRGDEKTLARVQEFLTGIASVDIAAIELDGRRHLLGRAIDPDARGRMVVDLVVRNLAVGHRFPGGTRDAQDTWLALRVVDQSGRTVAELDDASGKVHRLRVGMADEHGEVQLAREIEEFRAPAFDHTIAPRDAVIVRYAVELPSDAAGALRLEARLLHRSRSLALADETCRQSKTREGRAFLDATERMTGVRLDPCGELPVTEISRFTVTLGDPSSSSDVRPDHERLWELGLALSHQVQERLPEAREALRAAEQALADATLPDDERNAAQARILAALGAIAARQGRVDEALELADRVAELRPDHPFPHLLRGRALARVWRWEQAVPHLELAFAASPGSPLLAGELATALGSAGMHRRALEVAADALPRRPRDSTLLRAQALALRALGDPRAEAALELYYTHREPDVQPHLASDCGERDPDCARERVPVHVHE